MANPRTKVSDEELNAHLLDQINFLKSSADSFDRGFSGEAKRLALAIRVLVHDTGGSQSLLGVLGRKGGSFISTTVDYVEGNALTYHGLFSLTMGPSGSRYMPFLDGIIRQRWLPFEEWWNEVIFEDNQKRKMTRKDVILTAANQDGGAHVDSSLDAIYADLAKNNSLGWVAGSETNPIPLAAPERAAIRQIAHEMLKTIDPSYKKQADGGANVWVSGVSMVAVKEKGRETRGRTRESTKIGRNALCPCGSGIKYKHCHGKYHIQG